MRIAEIEHSNMDKKPGQTIRRKADSGRERAAPDVGQAPLLPGLKPVLEMLERNPERVDAVFLRKGRHGREMEEIVDLCRRARVRFSLLEAASFARVYRGGRQGVVARLFEAGYVDHEDLFASVTQAPLPLILALDQVQDPGNAGTLARTLYAMGGAGLLAPRHNGVYLGAAAAKASAGALERLPVARPANLGQALDLAKKQGFTVYGAGFAPGTALDSGSTPLDETRKKATGKGPVPVFIDALTADFRLPAILVLGSEESGMRPGTERRCDYLLSIPMLREFDSLNVAQAGGIIISSFLRNMLGKAATPSG
ncbi:MAG: RNA methyltransferase [Desulfovibrio sp.]|jgi:23S rRNA (guanosine2251-2'-O)-methyltransferase|nr:RNA methyltransferase [Desulfovibrio sp.]